MALTFTFEDSIPRQSRDGKDLPLLLEAIQRLNSSSDNEEIEFLSLRGDRRNSRSDVTSFITYSVTECGAINSWSTVKRACFDVSHYIGSYSVNIGAEVVTIEIRPRWGKVILSYLLQYTTGIYQPPEAFSAATKEKDGAEWLLALLWNSLFNQALRRLHIPKEYRPIQTNDRFFKGRLDVSRQIRENCVDQSRFACSHTPLTLDTTINQTIRHVVRLFSGACAFPSMTRDLAGYDERLAAFGVQSKNVSAAQIDSIRYTRMSAGYRPLMEASKAVIRKFGAGQASVINHAPSFFIDMAELWENFLLAILTRHLTPNYRVFSPNESGGNWLIAGNMREIRPDILIERDGEIVAILDAKFKGYTEIGKYAKQGISREDLYQMSTYLYHYGRSDAPILGLFVSPVAGTSQIIPERMSAHDQHWLGIANFDISGWETESVNISQIREAECIFVTAVQSCLDGVLTQRR